MKKVLIVSTRPEIETLALQLTELDPTLGVIWLNPPSSVFLPGKRWYQLGRAVMVWEASVIVIGHDMTRMYDGNDHPRQQMNGGEMLEHWRSARLIRHWQRIIGFAEQDQSYVQEQVSPAISATDLLKVIRTERV